MAMRVPEPVAAVSMPGCTPVGPGSASAAGPGTLPTSASLTGLSNLEIRTKSVEQTLIPLVSQISALISQRERLTKSERVSIALSCVVRDVCEAVAKFVHIGENIAEDNPEIRQEMLEACRETRDAGSLLAQIVSIRLDGLYPPGAMLPHPPSQPLLEERKLLRAARGLLSSVTRVLLLADRVLVLQILRAKDAVRQTLRALVHVRDFSEFVKLFSQYGSSMVDLARLSGERLQDLKDDKRKAQLASARQLLEKSTMMLLTSSKASLRHPDSQEARLNRDLVYARVSEALNLLSYAVTDGEAYLTDPEMRSALAGMPAGCGAGYVPSVEKHTAISVVLQRIEDTLEMIKMNLITSEAYDILKRDFQLFEEALTDFVDSAEIPHEQRQRVLQLAQLLKEQLQSYPVLGLDAGPLAGSNMDTSLSKAQQTAKSMKKELSNVAVQIATDLLKSYNEAEATERVCDAALSGDPRLLEDEAHRFSVTAGRLLEVSRMLKHISCNPAMLIQADRLETSLASLGRQCIFAAQTLVQSIGSRTAKENLDVFLEAWRSLVRDLLSVTTQCANQNKDSKTPVRMGYMSLPRPGRHGATAKPIRTYPSDFGSQEQARLVKNGLEMQMLSSEMDTALADKCGPPGPSSSGSGPAGEWRAEANNDIVKRAKNMSSMAYTMYLFTRGEGTLKTTQDLFTQAEFFTEEANRLCRAIREFGSHVPQGLQKVELVSTLEKIPRLIQQLSATIKNPTAGKTATFNKVETVIQQTKDLMNAIAKLVTTCFICATKYDLDYRQLRECPSSHNLRWTNYPPNVHLARGGHTGSSLNLRLPGEDSESLHSLHSQASSGGRLAGGPYSGRGHATAKR
ncbi:alpha-catulin-like [Paramacrobiotus metropolitanus]|uniref:alpha-catulin-like n=1 Tax=Paramacrobiotus metropolitanus TaxID=2943436 RepID=UPI002445BC25|nr:alpha-catulin-like [Paramacrobiotus metropolitanus]XP_055344807.1 alpha-catulin-like [Paramacrobiotus metropolitanus]XP_055344809.1 alpha-catulin-like [Paramacrobiotus metropolitanus]XP_055344810.1 alpha-catulin-like [Paramacrobiotus metropolitanus]